MNVNIALNSFYVLKYTSKTIPIYITVLLIQPSLSLSLSLSYAYLVSYWMFPTHQMVIFSLKTHFFKQF